MLKNIDSATDSFELKTILKAHKKLRQQVDLRFGAFFFPQAQFFDVHKRKKNTILPLENK